MMEIFFNMYKVKYTKLLELLRENEDINIGTEDTVHIHINLETIIMKMCNVDTVQYINISKNIKFEFISNVINLAAHYRLFFTRYKIKSKIFLHMPTFRTEYKNKIHNKEYRIYSDFKFSETGGNLPVYNLINDTVSFIELITEYIDGVYFICSNKIENSVIPYIINKELDENSKNFIVSGDLYDLQYVNHDFNMIIPKGDNSFICTSNNTIDYLKKLYECKGTYKFSSNFMTFIISMLGSKYRNIYNIKGIGIKTIFKTIQRAIDEKLVSNNIDNIHLLLNIIKPNIRETILNNYRCVDLYYQYIELNKSELFNITEKIVDKFDNVALKKNK